MPDKDFTRTWVNLAQTQLGARVISASDDFFGPKEALIRSEAPISLPDKYTDHGKWVDGWESRRKRQDGYDHCIIRLGHSGIIRGVDIDTGYFTGNYPPSASIDVCCAETTPDATTQWVRILPSSPLKPDAHNLFEIDNDYPWKYVRLNIYPDGGVARLRVYGQILPDWECHPADQPVNLLALENGGRAILCNDEHFGSMHNLIKSHPPVNMGDGWETRRRRTPGYDWAIFSLGRAGIISRISVETTFFKGNHPDSCTLHGAYVRGGSEATIATQSLFWPQLLPQSRLSPDTVHHFDREVLDVGAITHARINIFPDGGISRLKLYGTPAG